jgi:hypothetical protein
VPHHQQETPLKGIAEYGKIEQFLLTDTGGVLNQHKRPATQGDLKRINVNKSSAQAKAPIPDSLSLHTLEHTQITINAKPRQSKL